MHLQWCKQVTAPGWRRRLPRTAGRAVWAPAADAPPSSQRPSGRHRNCAGRSGAPAMPPTARHREPPATRHRARNAIGGMAPQQRPRGGQQSESASRQAPHPQLNVTHRAVTPPRLRHQIAVESGGVAHPMRHPRAPIARRQPRSGVGAHRAVGAAAACSARAPPAPQTQQPSPALYSGCRRHTQAGSRAGRCERETRGGKAPRDVMSRLAPSSAVSGN